MLGPTDYSGAFAAPDANQLLNSFNQGLGTAQNTMLTEQMIAQTNLAKAMRADTAAVAANPTPQAISQLSLKYPQMSEQFKRSYDMMTTDQQQAKLNQAVPIYAAIQNGSYDTAVDLLNKQADAYQNAGRQQDAVQARTIAQLVKDHPDQAIMHMGILLAGALGPEKFTDTFKTVGGERRAEQRQPAEVQKLTGEAASATAKGEAAPQREALESGNLSSQIIDRTARLSLDADKIKSDIQIAGQKLDIDRIKASLPEATIKNVNTAVQQSATAGATADKFEKIADQIDNAKLGSGIGASVTERFQEFWGNQDAKTQLRQEYMRVKNTGLMSLLPKSSEGTPFAPRSTSELNIFMKGLPSDTDNPKIMSQFLRSMATASRMEQIREDIKAQWHLNNKTLGNASKDLQINGVNVAKGTTYPQFEKEYLKSHLGEIYQQRANQTFNSRSYSRFANPEQPQQAQQPQQVAQ